MCRLFIHLVAAVVPELKMKVLEHLSMLAPEWLTVTVQVHKPDSGFLKEFTVAQL